MTPTKQDRSASRPGGFSISAGFDNPPIDSQATFRAIMTALAEPGSIREIPLMRARAPGLSQAMTALVLTLADFETKVWFDEGAASQAASYTRFHTGASVIEATSETAFAMVTNARTMPRFAAFAQGTLDYPDRSTTIIVEVEHLAENGGYRLRGPGIAGERTLNVAPLPPTFVEDWASNRAAYPCGVDVLFCCGTFVAALPRSTRLQREKD